MTDYEGWTETEISLEEYPSLSEERRGMDIRWRHGIRTATYYRLDPPAPKYREGEMRWLTLGDKRYLCQRASVSAWDAGVTLFTDDYLSQRVHTLSDPVVVVPAPTDEERAHFLSIYGHGAKPPMAGIFGNWLARVADAFRGESS